MADEAHRRNPRKRGGNHADEEFRGATKSGARIAFRDARKSSKEGHTVDALAFSDDEGRGKLRKDMGSRKQA